VKLPVDTSAIAFLCAMAPEPVLDFETKRPRADENGEPSSNATSSANAPPPGWLLPGFGVATAAGRRR
jgi:MYXO-CTERM domain-containing protein